MTNGTTIEFWVHGDPKPQPRTRAFVNRHTGRAGVYEPDCIKDWKHLVAIAAEKVRPAKPLEGPTRLDVAFWFRRPATHYGTGRNAGRLKDWAPRWHTAGRRHDVDNLAKVILDCATQLGLIREDAQVCEARICKQYVRTTTETPGAHVVLAPITQGDATDDSSRELFAGIQG